MTHHGERLPAVTVIIPARNAATTLAAQLMALSTQTYAGRFEVLLVDNGSVDGTSDLARDCIDLAGRLRVVRADEGTGAGFARNLGARFSEAEFLAFCDADDVVEPQWLDRLIATAHDHDAVTGPLRYARALNEPAVLRWYGHEPDGLSATDLHDVGDFMPYATSANLAVWRTVFLELGGFDEAFLTAEDKEFSWRLQLAGYRLGFAVDAIVNYRLRPSLRGLAQQQYRYGQRDALLYSRFDADGMPRRSPSVVAKSWARLALEVPMMFDARRRGEVLRLVPRYAGRVSGSLTHRTLYL